MLETHKLYSNAIGVKVIHTQLKIYNNLSIYEVVIYLLITRLFLHF